MQDQLCVLCSPDKGWKQGQTISRDEFKKQRFLLREKGSGTRDVFDHVIAHAGIHIIPAWEAMSTSTLINAAVTGGDCQRLGGALDVVKVAVHVGLGPGASRGSVHAEQYGAAYLAPHGNLGGRYVYVRRVDPDAVGVKVAGPGRRHRVGALALNAYGDRGRRLEVRAGVPVVHGPHEVPEPQRRVVRGGRRSRVIEPRLPGRGGGGRVRELQDAVGDR